MDSGRTYLTVAEVAIGQPAEGTTPLMQQMHEHAKTYLFAYSSDIGKPWLVRKLGESILSDHTVEFILSSALDIGKEYHGENECQCSRPSLSIMRVSSYEMKVETVT